MRANLTALAFAGVALVVTIGSVLLGVSLAVLVLRGME